MSPASDAYECLNVCGVTSRGIACQSALEWDPRIASGRNVTGTEFCELISETRPARWRGCGRGGVIITRSAVHSPGPYFRLHHGLCRHGCDDRLRHLLPEGPKQALNDRMLLVAECRRIDCGEPAYDGQRSDLRLDRKPVLDRQEIRIELRGHTNALLVSPFRPAVRGSHFGGRGHRAERAGRPRLPIRSPSSSCAARISASSCTGSRVRYAARRRRLTAGASFGCASARSYGVAGG